MKTRSSYSNSAHRIGNKGNLFDFDPQVIQDLMHIDITLVYRNPKLPPGTSSARSSIFKRRQH